jgi:hypothetical protein
MFTPSRSVILVGEEQLLRPLAHWGATKMRKARRFVSRTESMKLP